MDWPHPNPGRAGAACPGLYEHELGTSFNSAEPGAWSVSSIASFSSAEPRTRAPSGAVQAREHKLWFSAGKLDHKFWFSAVKPEHELDTSSGQVS